MGVSGWNRLLAEEGWTIDAKSASCCSTSLWMEPNHRLAFASAAALADDDNDNGDEEEDPESSSAKNTRRQWLLSDRIVEIPPSSELHIDGYCLCFHLFDVAYARHRNSVLHSKSNHHQRPCARPNILQSLTPQQVRHLNPSFLPLKLLADVTTEFVRTLTNNNNTKNGMQLIVYWDGDRRVVHKHATDTKRQSRLDDEWNDYHLYCQSGRMPTVNKICQWATKLPKHRLFCAQVLHSLQASRAVTMVHCDEEADRILAMAVRNKPNAYIVGLDSDFCFFPDANYIPLPTLHAAKGGGGATLPLVTACVIRRDALAESLGLPDESAMLELAILLGNDYVDPDTAQFVDRPPPHPRRVGAAPKIDFLRERGEGFRVTSESDEVTEAMRFVRMLYSLESLEEEELFAVSDDDDDDSSLEESSLDDDNEENTMSMRPMYDDEDVDTSLLVIQPGKDRFFKDVVRRCLQAYVDQGLQDADARRPIELTQEHIATFEQLTINNNQSYKEIDNAMGDKDWRPEWLDVKVVYLIEKLIGKCIWDQYTSPIVSLYPPYFFFDQYKYHALLISHRGNKTKNVAPSFPLKIGPVDSPKAEEVRLVLPVDEFEDTILASVRNNKVTIIHGETGCGE